MTVNYKKLMMVGMTGVVASAMVVGCGKAEDKKTASTSAPSAAATATSAAKQEPVSLEFWTISLQPKFNDYFNKLIADYKVIHPNVSIDWKDFPYDALQSKLLTSVASGNTPDVVNLNTELGNQMGSKGALVDFNQYLKPEEKGLYFDGIFNSTVLNGKAYGLPWYTGLSLMFYNKKLVEKAGLDPKNPPKTMDELISWATQIKAKTGASGWAEQVGAKFFTLEGVPILSADKKKAAFNDAKGIAAVEAKVKLYKDGINPKEDANFDKQVQYYSSEQVAFQLSGSTFINRIKTAAPEIYANTLAAPIPTGKAGDRTSNTMNIAVPAKSKNVKEAVEFAKFVTNAKAQLDFSKAANTLPSTKDSAKDVFFTQTDGTLEAQAKLASVQGLDKATDALLGVEKAADVNKAVQKHLQNVFLNNADVKTELDAAAKEVNDLLAQ
ncbi:ABC transporter substrate-binding protein [Paenibacillus roseipurpureus]|uniref:Sugar ABC transporter substrate-binding protein n=1 Tax=Paenibacillus roseopurpureus TaxID=2918901 RepID=A0AA96LPZ4_9BACL|nr:sugar ABC transporter substrate-binding protein [Paenibacillus sp. MBLB1832]WNR46127.1 sugar ABC transporter substrate-binding protein [Paenibacillus sp. MBLB1832]